MASIVKGNKKSASEDDLGLLHSLTTKIMIAKVQAWVRAIEGGAEVDLIVDMKQMANIVKFIQLNGIVCADPSEQAGNALNTALEDIKKEQHLRLVANGRGAVSFTDDEEY